MSRPFRSAAALVAVVLAAAMLPAAWSSADAAPRGDGLYRSLDDFRPTGGKVRVRPDDYTAYRVDTREVRADLARAPELGSSGATVFRVPTPTGGTERFAVQRTQVMEAGLAALHPEIRTWAGYSLDHRGTTVALDVTPMGFHASVRGPNGQGAWFVDPAFNERGTTQHLSYYGSSVDNGQDLLERDLPQVQRSITADSARARAGTTVKQRVYRLALLSDPTYAHYFGSQNVTAEKATLMTRVNQVYNDDVAIKMILVAGTDKLNLDTRQKATGANGPCGAHPCYDPRVDKPGTSNDVPGQLDFCDVGTLVRNQKVLGQLIGASSYDIGHIALGTNGGGIAGLGVVGATEKALGCTGIPKPTGDFYAIDYVAHEMGHQFGGNHTFNGNQWNCSGGNRNAGTSVEPGSGSSIMAYAGICRADNLQRHSDPYFSQRSIQEIGRYTGGGRAAPVVEVQDISLKGFDNDNDSFTLSYPGSPVTRTFVRGSTGTTAYTAANIKAAVTAMTGENVTVAGWGYDYYGDFSEYPAKLTKPDDTGFEVIFAGSGDPYTAASNHLDMKLLQTSNLVNVQEAKPGETAKGGPARNPGFRVISSRNHAPVVRAPASRTIPMRTPFTLRGHARDRDGQRLTYLWEQNDRGGQDGTALVSNHKRNGPLFRVFGTVANVSDRDASHSPAPGQNHAGTSGTRTFPDLAQILHRNTNAKSGKCPRVRPPRQRDIRISQRTLNCYSEFLPVRGYRGSAGSAHPAMHFRLTARDSALGGGGVGHDDVTLRLAPHAGPFLVRSFGGRHASVKGGKKAVVRWRVNGTKRLAHQVRIVLSTDNGRTWTKVLGHKTANDGRARVKFPKKRTRHAWIRIEAVHNYFFDTNDRAFRIR